MEKEISVMVDEKISVLRDSNLRIESQIKALGQELELAQSNARKESEELKREMDIFKIEIEKINNENTDLKDLISQKQAELDAVLAQSRSNREEWTSKINGLLSELNG
jgi:predicted  nucleic acid-binding Zn-ribbon protein